MFGIKKLFAQLTHYGRQESVDDSPSQIPTVKFDTSRLTSTVKAQLKKDIASFDEIGITNAANIYSIALEALRRGQDAHHLFSGLMAIDGMQKGAALRITRCLLSRGAALMTTERRIALGLTQATWAYAKAPCMPDAKNPSAADLKRDADHKALDGKPFDVRTGMKVGDTYTWPGFEEGCKCISKSVLPF